MLPACVWIFCVVTVRRDSPQKRRPSVRCFGGARRPAPTKPTAHCPLPKEKLSPSPGRGGGLTTAIANSRSHGIKPTRANRRRIRVRMLAARLKGTTDPHWLIRGDLVRGVVVRARPFAAVANPSCSNKAQPVGLAICGRLSPARGGSIRLLCYRESWEFSPTVFSNVSTRRNCPWSL